MPEGETGIYLHGDLSGPPPTLIGTIAEAPLLLTTTKTPAWRGSTSPAWAAKARRWPAARAEGSTRVRATAGGVGAAGIALVQDCVVSNSVAASSGQAGFGLFAIGYGGGAPGTVRNVTAIATGAESVGIAAINTYESTGTYRLDVTNTIASGDKERPARSCAGLRPGRNSRLVLELRYGGRGWDRQSLRRRRQSDGVTGLRCHRLQRGRRLSDDRRRRRRSGPRCSRPAGQRAGGRPERRHRCL